VNLAVIVPWGTDNGPREQVWNFLRPRWEATGLDLIVAADPLFGTLRYPEHFTSDVPDVEWTDERRPFSVARAINRAVRLAPPGYDAFVLFGADHVPDAAVLEHAEAMLGQHEWLPLYRRIAYASEQSTADWLCTNPVDLIGTWVEEPQFCPGVLAVRRELFERVGGMDERYEGWGYEDNALYDSLRRAAMPGPVTNAVLRELWHPRDHRDLDSPNRALYLGGSRG